MSQAYSDKRIAEVIDRALPENDYRQITFQWIDTGETFKEWFPLLYEHFHHASCPDVGQRMTWEEIQSVV